MKNIATIFSCLSIFLGVYGQDLERFGKGKMLGLSGAVSSSGTFYNANGVKDRRDPFNYFTSGNLNVGIYDWSIPLSFSYSNQNKSFHQPFNRYGLSPTYKGITVHAGYRSMSFSNYSVSGHLFLGGGFDLKCSDNVKVSAFYGRLQQAVHPDTTNKNSQPAYRRMGGGIKIAFANQRNSLDVIVFKARDDMFSLSPIGDGLAVKPQENVVVAVNGRATVLGGLSINTEVATSAMSSDIRAERSLEKSLYSKFKFAFTPRISSSYFHAVKSSLQYSFPFTSVGFAYERVDPGYRTLGAYYFNSNLETFAFTNSTAFFKKKIRVNGQMGTQRNNLAEDELNTMRRISGSVAMNFQISQKLSCTANYSNFRTVINFRSQFDFINNLPAPDNPDTLNYRQVSRSAGLNGSCILGEGDERKQNLNVNLNYQESDDNQAARAETAGTRFYNVNVSYSITLPELNLNLNVAANGNIAKTNAGINKIFGPSLSFRKAFFSKKLSANTTVSFNEAFSDGKRVNSILNLRTGANYVFNEKHSLDLTCSSISRLQNNGEAKSTFRELVIQFSYSYSFSVK